MKVIVAGTRDFYDYELLEYKLNRLLVNLKDVEIVSGNAGGADSLGERYALEHELKLTKFPADWTKYGKRAGYIRNKQMAEYAQCLVAFWDGVSRGTKLMIDLAHEYKLQVRVIKFN